jgi:polynucleotide 5'-hydroxyl-kinase GRC3/NOL9
MAIRTVLETATRALVLGPADSGKSTLCRLLEQARGARRSAAILDLDLGQKLIGPPACVTPGTLTRQGPVLRGLAFAGSTAPPVAASSLLLAGAARLAACAAADLLIVNTCGYLRGRGLALKRAAIVATAADTLLVLGQDPAGAAVLSSPTERTVLCLPVITAALDNLNGVGLRDELTP